MVVLLYFNHNPKKEGSKDVKLIIKYGVISYILIFIVCMLVNSFRIDFSSELQQDSLEIVKVLGAQFVTNNLLTLPPANIIGFVIYFYIFPIKKSD